MSSDPLNLNEIFQSVMPSNFGSSSIRKEILLFFPLREYPKIFSFRINSIRCSSSDDTTISIIIFNTKSHSKLYSLIGQFSFSNFHRHSRILSNKSDLMILV